MSKRLLAIAAVLLTLPFAAHAAIGFDAGTAGGYTATANGFSFNHTVTTTAQSVLFVATFGKAPSPTDSITAVTYNGVAMTKVGSKPTQGPDGRYEALWYLIAPASGTHAVVLTATGGDGAADAASYTGVAQVVPINAVTTNSNGVSSTSIATAITPTVRNSWVVASARNEVGATGAGGGTTLRVNDTSGNGMYDSGGPVAPIASKTLIATTASATYFGVVMAAISPYVPRQIRGFGISR